MCPFIHLEFTRFPIPAHSPWDAKPLLAAKIVEVRDTSLASKLGPGISNMEFWNRTHGALRFYTKNSKPQGHEPCMKSQYWAGNNQGWRLKSIRVYQANCLRLRFSILQLSQALSLRVFLIKKHWGFWKDEVYDNSRVVIGNFKHGEVFPANQAVKNPSQVLPYLYKLSSWIEDSLHHGAPA